MERLRIVLVIAALVATAPTSPGQLSPDGSPDHPSDSSAVRSYVVIGDVRNFNYFPLSGRTTVQQAVLNAGILSDSVSVSVIRASHDRALWTQTISSTSGDSGELVMHGDILVVQSLLPVTEPVQKNAALRTDAGVIVVALTEDVIAVGDVLLQTNNQPSPGQRLRISSRFQGRTPVAKADLSDQIAHGDVLTVSSGNRSRLQGFGSLVPASSEWQDHPSTVQRPMPVPQTEQLQNTAPGTLPDEQPFGMQMQIHGQFRDSTGSSAEPVASEANPDAATSEYDASMPLAVKSISQMNPVSEADGPAVAPEPPIEQSELAVPVSAPAASGGMNFWNTILIAGLLIAGTLVLASSLRADEDTGTNESQSQEQPVARTVKSSASGKTGTRNNAGEPLGTETTITQSTVEPSQAAGSFADIVNLTSEVVIREVAQTNVTPSSLVSPNEWFGRDWLERHPIPGLGQTIIREPAAELVSQQTSSPAIPAEHAPKAPVPETPRKPVFLMENQIAEVLADIQPANDDPASAVRATGFTELEDLLQNRLPIDLCEARLPLRIALFGRPAGPRRLRIDAAHTTIPAPHMNRSAERKREEAVTVSDAQPAAEEQSTGALGSLDRALHQLQERTDS